MASSSSEQDVQVALAERLPALQEQCPCTGARPIDDPHNDCANRGWVPAVTLEALLMAMDALDRPAWLSEVSKAPGKWFAEFSKWGDHGQVGRYGATPLEAACNAAMAALEASPQPQEPKPAASGGARSVQRE